MHRAFKLSDQAAHNTGIDHQHGQPYMNSFTPTPNPITWRTGSVASISLPNSRKIVYLTSGRLPR
jgi:hypothetical protein